MKPCGSVSKREGCTETGGRLKFRRSIIMRKKGEGNVLKRFYVNKGVRKVFN